MISRPTVLLDPRDSRQALVEFLNRRPGYIREWLAPEKSAGAGLAAVFARYLQAVIDRLNQAPDKNKLAFLDTLGLSLAPAQAARVPVVFQLNEQAASGSAPAGTAVAAAPPPGSSDQIVFETERATGVTAGRIVQVFSLWPGRDEYIDHSAAFAAGTAIRLFDRALLAPTPHEIYLAHATLLALAGNVELNVTFELTHPSAEPLSVVWEYWDGQVWRGFLMPGEQCLGAGEKNPDSTGGLTSSGTFTLKADCAQAAKRLVNGVDGYWLRGRLDEPLPADPDKALPEVESIRLSSTTNRALAATLQVSPPYAVAALGAAPAQPGVVPLAAGDAPSAEAVAGGPVLAGRVLNSAGQPVAGAVVIVSDPTDPVFGQVTSIETIADGRFRLPAVPLGVKYEFLVRFAGLEASARAAAAPTASQPLVDLTLTVDGLSPDKAFADSTKLDVSKPFYPMGAQPQPGSTFYFTSDEVFSKPGAKVRAYVARTRSPQDEAAITVPAGQTLTTTRLVPNVVWEYWNGRLWAPLGPSSNLSGSPTDLDTTEVLDFTVPIDMAATKVNDQDGLWIRARLASGSYGFSQQVEWVTGPNNTTNRFTYVVHQPPAVAEFCIGYTWQFGPFPPEQVQTYNDFQYEDHTYEAVWPGATFLPFRRTSDLTPALYLGFGKKPPVDQIGLYFDIVEEQDDFKGPALLWEYWDGFSWRELPAEDETSFLRLPGIVAFVAAPDDTALSRFGQPLHWLRARLKEDGPPGEPVVNAIYPNAVWASQRRTLRDVPVGASTGTADEVFQITQTPVLAGEQIELRELAGPRANVEWRILAMELFGGDLGAVKAVEEALGREGLQTDISKPPLRLRRDRKKQVTEAWVGWESRPHLFFSGPGDRHYAIDRSLGRLYFGNGVNGRIPPPGAAILVRQMASGGGAAGNVPAKAVSQLLGVLPGVQTVFNPKPGEGGADGEMGQAALERGPQTVRHRGRAIAPADYETMAREASSAVAVTRAIPARNPAGRPLPGWVTLLIIPHSAEDRPYPSFGLREQVTRYLEERAPASIAAIGRITVTGPEYLPVDVSATIAPVMVSEAGTVERRAREALKEFLHPLRGGPAGRGWDLGRDVYLSDVAAVLERVQGLDYVEELTLLLGGAPQGESVPVADDRIVVAGEIMLKLKAAAR